VNETLIPSIPGAPSRAEPGHSHGAGCCGSASPSGAASAPAFAAEGEHLFRIPTMDCAVEESEIRRALDKVAGIEALNFQLGARTLSMRASAEALPAALEAIRKAGFDPKPLPAREAGRATAAAHADSHSHGSEGAGHAGHAHDHDDPDHAHGSGIPRLGAALALAIAAEGLHFAAADVAWMNYLGLALAAVAIWLSGVDTYAKGIRALLRGRLNISALMSVAVTGAFLIGQWPEAAMVMALYAIAELIEGRAADRARNAIQGLLTLAPAQADVRQDDLGWRSLPSEQVPIGAIVRIRPGERVPLDGVVTEGRSAVNQAPVTGESLPVERGIGDIVFAGTINETAELQFRVSAVASDTTLARIIHAVEQAQGTRAPTQRFVDRFAAIYTPAVFVLALAAALLLPLLTGIGWLAALYKALVLLWWPAPARW